jgi:ankyrin repeat protein
MCVENGAVEDFDLTADTWLAAMAASFPLHAAVAANDLSAAQQVLLSGARVDDLDDQQWTPLMWAVSAEAARMLLAAGADPVYATGWGESVLMAVSRRADAATVGVILDAGVGPDTPDDVGNVALGEAAGAGNVDAIRALLRGGANPDAQTTSGESPIWAAVRGDHLDALDLLLRAGARPDHRLSTGQTAADLAEDLGHAAAAAMLKQFT